MDLRTAQRENRPDGSGRSRWIDKNSSGHLPGRVNVHVGNLVSISQGKVSCCEPNWWTSRWTDFLANQRT